MSLTESVVRLSGTPRDQADLRLKSEGVTSGRYTPVQKVAASPELFDIRTNTRRRKIATCDWLLDCIKTTWRRLAQWKRVSQPEWGVGLPVSPGVSRCLPVSPGVGEQLCRFMRSKDGCFSSG